MSSREEIVCYRIERAQEALKEADILAGGSRWNACVNRLYYACFYSVSALLLARGLSSSKHTGVRSLFNLHFVKTKQVSRELGATYNDLFENRQKSDYMDLVRFSEAEVRPWITQAGLFVTEVKALVRSEMAAADQRPESQGPR